MGPSFGQATNLRGTCFGGCWPCHSCWQCGLSPKCTARIFLHAHVYPQVSVDGQTFSHSLRRYDIVGLPVAIRAVPDTITLKAAAASPIPGLQVFTLDRAGHRMLDYDRSRMEVRAAVYSGGAEAGATTGALVNATGQVARFQRGVATFPGLALLVPRAGVYELRLVSALGPAAPVAVVVTEGVPARLHIVRQPSAQSNNVGPLQDQPALELLDAAGNVVTDPGVLGLRVEAHVRPRANGTKPVYAFFNEGYAEFQDVTVVAAYGVTYRLVFVVHPVPGLRVANATSRAILARPCASTEFWVLGAEACRPCVGGAVCNGVCVRARRRLPV